MFMSSKLLSSCALLFIEYLKYVRFGKVVHLRNFNPLQW